MVYRGLQYPSNRETRNTFTPLYRFNIYDLQEIHFDNHRSQLQIFINPPRKGVDAFCSLLYINSFGFVHNHRSSLLKCYITRILQLNVTKWLIPNGSFLIKNRLYWINIIIIHFFLLLLLSVVTINTQQLRQNNTYIIPFTITSVKGLLLYPFNVKRYYLLLYQLISIHKQY